MLKLMFGPAADIGDVAEKPGNVIITEDTGEMYADNSKGTRQKISYSKGEIDEMIAAEAEARHEEIVEIPLATEDKSGLMPPESMMAIETLTGKVESLEQGGVWRGTFATYDALSAAFPTLDVSYTAWTVNDFVYIQADETQTGAQTAYIVTVNGNVKTLVYSRNVTVPIAQATNSTLGVVKGAAANGKGFIENDGSISVVGFDGLATSTALSAHTSNTSNPHTVTKTQVGLGNVDDTADVNKSVASAGKLTTARTIAIGGKVTGSATSFDGTGNISINVTGLSQTPSDYPFPNIQVFDNMTAAKIWLTSNANGIAVSRNKASTANSRTQSGATIATNGATFSYASAFVETANRIPVYAKTLTSISTGTTGNFTIYAVQIDFSNMASPTITTARNIAGVDFGGAFGTWTTVAANVDLTSVNDGTWFLGYRNNSSQYNARLTSGAPNNSDINNMGLQFASNMTGSATLRTNLSAFAFQIQVGGDAAGRADLFVN